MVKRIFVEKKAGFDVEGQKLLADLTDSLQLPQITGVRVISRYDVEDLSQETYESAKHTIFSEPTIDRVYEEEIELGADCFYFAVEYLPGQYDQRADSAAQCIRMLDTQADSTVRSAKVYVIGGRLTTEEKKAIVGYCINPVDSRQAQWEKPDKLRLNMREPEAVAVLYDFQNWSDYKLEAYRKAMGFAMSEGDLRSVRAYFASEDRDPTITELRVIDTYWSDHCRHTTFHTKIKKVTFEAGPYGSLVKAAYEDYLELRKKVYGTKEKDICLMDMAVIGAKSLKQQGKLSDLDESEEINACSIKVKALIDGEEQDWLVMFKNETHNHPTEIEPFGGAATCLGGAIRDPLSGRVYVYQAMRVSGSGDPRASVSDTLTGKLPQRKITKRAADGYSSYGNQIGLATGQVTEIYHKDYQAKRMEIGAVIGAAPAIHVRRSVPVAGDCIVLVGGKTGRDGCGGATGSSKEHTEDSLLTCGAEVQKGNPPVERNMQRFFRRQEVATLIKRCNDFGAGGVSVAIGELAEGIDVNLDLVPKKYDGLDGTELAISESQERMAVVVEQKDCVAFIQMAGEENLEATQVAVVTDTGRFRMFWRSECILSLSRAFLDTNGVKQETEVFVRGTCERVFDEKNSQKQDENKSGKAFLADTVSGLNCCSQKGLTEQFDSTIGAGSVLMPLGGKYQLTPACGMAAKLPVTDGDTNTATLMTFGFDEAIAEKSPYHSALYAVVDSATKITAMGGDYARARLTFQEYFERLNLEPERWGKPFAALLGALQAQMALEIPAIGGKDSMSGTFMDIHVPPTLVSFAVSTIEAEKVLSPELKSKKSKLVFVFARLDENEILDFEEYKRNMRAVQDLMAAGKVLSASTVGKGGLFTAVTKMAAGNGIGFALSGASMESLVAPCYGALLLEIDGKEDIPGLFSGCTYSLVGETLEEDAARVKVATPYGQEKETDFCFEPLQELIACWEAPLEGVFPVTAQEEKEDKQPTSYIYEKRNTKKPMMSVARPRVFIPAFPGTNCELDSKRAFDRAGGVGHIQIIRNQNGEDLSQSIVEMAKNIKDSQIIMIPGGFSGGDEPDGSAKFITALFRNPLVQEAVEDLLQNRDGLILGICNGFQALIKLGLLPYGHITTADENSATLSYNRIGRHVSCLVRTRIASVKSPWLAGTQVGDLHTIPISHGEGRFIASQELLGKLSENGQIATQYVDMEGRPTMDPGYNPNGSAAAVCGITSPDGRIFGKMGHSERIGENLYKNVGGNKDQRLFESGVAYFR